MSRFALTVALTLLCTAAAFTLGCNNPVKPPMTGTEDYVTFDQYPQVFVEYELSKYINVTGPAEFDRAQLGEDDPMSVTVPVRSLADKTINLQYRFTFFDNTGRPLRQQSGWRWIQIMSRNQIFLEGNAIDTTAADWRLDIRRGR